MWIMFSGGILSVAIRPPRTVRRGDDRALQARARDPEHLRRFRRDYCPGLSRVIGTPAFDYQYRAYVSSIALAAAMTRVVEDIDYANFKSTIERRYGDRKLHRTLLGVWDRFDRDYSERPEYPIGDQVPWTAEEWEEMYEDPAFAGRDGIVLGGRT